MSKQNILFALAGAALVGVIWAAAHTLGTSESQVIRGAFDVSYITENRKGTERGGYVLRDVSTIRLCPGYVVLEERNGSSHVLFSESTPELSWKRVDATTGKK